MKIKTNPYQRVSTQEKHVSNDSKLSIEYDRVSFLVSLLTPTVEVVKGWSDWDYQKLSRLVELIWYNQK